MSIELLCKKLGMSQVFIATGEAVPVTVLEAGPNFVVQKKTVEKDGYSAVQLGTGAVKVKNMSKPERGHFAKAKVEPKQKVAEFRVSEDALIDVGAELTVDHFVNGQYVDVVGTILCVECNDKRLTLIQRRRRHWPPLTEEDVAFHR